MSALRPLHLRNAGLERRAEGLRTLRVLHDTDLLLVDAVAERFGVDDAEVLLGLALAARAPRAGHVGVNLRAVRQHAGDERLHPDELPEGFDPASAWPADASAWQEAVLASSMVGGLGDTQMPFVAQPLSDGDMLVMSRRMWREQERLAVALAQLATSAPSFVLSEAAITEGVTRMFGARALADASEAVQAVRTVARRRLTVVTGGPGTGKTYSIKRILALLMEAAPEGRPLRIELAAPTGKAAVRMAEAIAEKLDDFAPDVRERLIGLEPRTLHKLLRVRPDGHCRYGAENPLAADVVVVDEASMVDIGLFRQLCEAIGDGARLVLLGDRDQLASVEAGTVLADIVSYVLDGEAVGEGTNAALADAIVAFRTNHRSKEAPTVAAIAQAIQGAGTDMPSQVRRWMTGDDGVTGETLPGRVGHLGVPEAGGRPKPEQLQALARPYLAQDGYLGRLMAHVKAGGQRAGVLQERAVHLELLAAFERYRVLTVHRRGPLGVEGLNRAFTTLAQDALKGAVRGRAAGGSGGAVRLRRRLGFWLGQPVIVLRNAYDVGLMNGDIGLVLPGREGRLVGVFPTTDGDKRDCRQVALGRLPEHETAFCMTIHKSQGSQFERVAMVLAGRASPIQTRELIYTGITRTSSRLDWLGAPEELERDLGRPISRVSGLAALLWATGGG